MITHHDWRMVRLTPEEVAANHGADRQDYADKHNLYAKYANAWVHGVGYGAEQAVAKHRKEVMGDWRLPAERARGFDTAGVEVRSTRNPWDDFIFLPRDRVKAENNSSLVYVCVLTWQAPTYWLAGWITAGEAMIMGTPGITRKGAERCWYVGHEHLYPLNELWLPAATRRAA